MTQSCSEGSCRVVTSPGVMSLFVRLAQTMIHNGDFIFSHCSRGMRSPLGVISTNLLRQVSAPINGLLQASCVSLGIMFKFDATHDFCHKTQNAKEK